MRRSPRSPNKPVIPRSSLARERVSRKKLHSQDEEPPQPQTQPQPTELQPPLQSKSPPSPPAQPLPQPQLQLQPKSPPPAPAQPQLQPKSPPPAQPQPQPPPPLQSKSPPPAPAQPPLQSKSPPPTQPQPQPKPPPQSPQINKRMSPSKKRPTRTEATKEAPAPQKTPPQKTTAETKDALEKKAKHDAFLKKMREVDDDKMLASPPKADPTPISKDVAPPAPKPAPAEVKDKKPVAVLPTATTENVWKRLRCGDAWPKEKLVKALDKPLDTIYGEKPDQYVAMWFSNGQPIMGRAYEFMGKIMATFGMDGKEYKLKLKTNFDVLMCLPEAECGYEYKWVPYSQAMDFGVYREWTPVSIQNKKGDTTPCVVNVDKKQLLGRADCKNEQAFVVFNGREWSYEGVVVHKFPVLCRKAKPGFKLT